MTLSALRTNLPLRLASLHVRCHRDETCDFDLLPRPVQLNVLADHLATDAFMVMDLRAAAKTTEFYLLPACRVYLHGTGYNTSQRKTHSHDEFSGYEPRAYIE
jgi:hypothetical protein